MKVDLKLVSNEPQVYPKDQLRFEEVTSSLFQLELNLISSYIQPE
jgi:hypothetical protein